MGMWSCAESGEEFVTLWIPMLLKEDWPAVHAALVRDSGCAPGEMPLESVCVGLAAADIVGSALSGHPDPEMPEVVAVWVKKNRSSFDPNLTPLAVSAVRRAVDYYEDNWAEGDETLGCQSAANELLLILGETDDDVEESREH